MKLQPLEGLCAYRNELVVQALTGILVGQY